MDKPTVSLLRLQNSEPNPESRITAVSLPIPMNAELPAGLAGLATQSVNVGWWPDSRSGGRQVPRRRLVYGISDKELPAEVALGKPAAVRAKSPAIQVSIPIVLKDHVSMLPHEVGEMQFTCGKKKFGLRLGVRWKEELHWWEWLRLEQVFSGPVVTAYRVGGFIEVYPLKYEDIYPDNDASAKRSSWLHRHNWLFAEAYVLCFANGVMQFTCRHVNNHRFDEGRVQHDMVPVIGFSDAGNVDTTLDGKQARFQTGDATLDLADALPMVSPEHPGALRREDDMIVYQPYEGVEIAGDGYDRQGTGGFLVRASEKQMPRGIARTVRFNASLTETAPVISRLTVPEWWYAMSGDMWVDPALPVRDYWDHRIETTYTCNKVRRHGTFDANFIADIFEGEVPHTQCLYFYRSGQVEHWRRAIRDAYYIADVGYDHATEGIRMHDYPLDGSTSPALQRTTGMLFGYLETGDPYLLDCAVSASEHWYAIDRHNWPRFAYGRDGHSIRGLVFLWDYTGRDEFRFKAREAMTRMLQCQQEDGSYRDQGGGTGIHAGGHLPVKPWMTNLATDPVVDYLERSPDAEPDLLKSVLKAADFQLQCAVERDGKLCWPYQVRYGESLYSPWVAARNDASKGQLPTEMTLMHGHKARLLNVATRRTGDTRYFDTWLKFFDAEWAHKPETWVTAQPFNKRIQYLMYGQAHSWNAQWQNGKLIVDPIATRFHSEMSGTILTPRGPVKLKLAQAHAGNGHAPTWKIVEQAGPPGLRVTLAGSTGKRPRVRPRPALAGKRR